MSPERITESPHRAGFAVTARLLCEPDENEPDESEKVQQAYLLAHRPTDADQARKPADTDRP